MKIVTLTVIAAVMIGAVPHGQSTSGRSSGKRLIAHRGASGYAPEHTLAADFTLAEIKRLDAGSWFDPKFRGERVPTWEEAIAAVGDAAGLYPELKSPPLYRARGIDMGSLFVASLRRLMLTDASKMPMIVQSFDEQVLRDLLRELPKVPLTFLIERRDGSQWLTAEGISRIAQFASGIGPAKALLDGRHDIVRMAHMAGLTVTPYTFNTAGHGRFPDVRKEMRYYLYDLGVDAVFTDNPDLFPKDGGS